MSVTAEEWRNRSLNGEVCGIIFCTNHPTNQCPKCNLHYCYEQIRLHMHELSEEKSKKEEHNLGEGGLKASSLLRTCRSSLMKPEMPIC